MHYTIEPLTPAHRAAATEALVEAFVTDPLFTFTIPNPRDRREWIRHLFGDMTRQLWNDQDSRIVLHNDTDVVATLLAGPYPPPKLTDALRTLRLALFPAPWRPNLLDFRPMFTYTKLWSDMHAKVDHVYVYVIGVHPDHQRRRLGRKLMEGLKERCDARNIPIYLETQTAENVPFYESLDFTLTEEHAPFDEGPHTWGFFRKPSAPTSQ